MKPANTLLMQLPKNGDSDFHLEFIYNNQY